MGSQTLEILRQGVWASLTGGWFYDPHQDVFCNVVHLYLWLFLLCTPFVTYLYFPKTFATWWAYCVATTLTITVLKIINMHLHKLYDKAQAMSESNLKNPFKDSKEIEGEEECGIEMQVLGADMTSKASVDQTANQISEANSILSVDNANTIDLKVDVHRKNSSESCESISYFSTGLIPRNQTEPFSSALNVEKTVMSTSRSEFDNEIKSEENSKCSLEFHEKAKIESDSYLIDENSIGDDTYPISEKKEDHLKKRKTKTRIGRQNSLDSAAAEKLSRTERTPSETTIEIQENTSADANTSKTRLERTNSKFSRLQRHRSSETHEERQRHTRNLYLPIHHEHKSVHEELNSGGRRDVRSHLQAWILGSSDMYLEDSYTKSDLGIEQIDNSRSSNTKNYHLHQHHQRTPMRKDSNSTMSALQLPMAYSVCPITRQSNVKKRRHSNTASTGKSMLTGTNHCNSVSNVRRIKSTALDTGPHPSIPHLPTHPNSAEAISGQMGKNSQGVLLPPLVRNPHLKFGSFSCAFTSSSNAIIGPNADPVYPIVEQADEKSLHSMSIEDTDNVDNNYEERLDNNDNEEDDDNDGAKAVSTSQRKRFSTTESESEMERPTTNHSTDSETDNNGSRSPLLNKVRSFEKAKSPDRELQKSDMIILPKHLANVKKHKTLESGCPISDCERISASSKDMLLESEAKYTVSAVDLTESVNNKSKPDIEGADDEQKPKDMRHLGAIPKTMKRRDNVDPIHKDDNGSNQQSTQKRTNSASKIISRTSSSASSRSFSVESDIYKSYKVPSDSVWPIYTATPTASSSVAINSSSQYHLPSHNMPPMNNYFYNNFNEERERRYRPYHHKLHSSSKQTSGESAKLDEQTELTSRHHDHSTSSFVNSTRLSIQGLMTDFENSLASNHHGRGHVGGVAGVLNVSGHVEITDSVYCDYWRPPPSLSAEKPAPVKRFYKYRLNFCGSRHEIKIEMDRLQLLALFDRDLNWFHVVLAIFLSVTVAFLGSTILQLGFYKDIYAFVFCLVIAGSQYSLIKSVQPDAASPIHGFNKTVAYSRPIYFCICSSLLIAFDNVHRSLHLNTTHGEMRFFGMEFMAVELFGTLTYILAKVLLVFPILFSLGLFPQINTFTMYLLEQVDMHVFGGNAASSLLGSFLCVLRSIFAVSILYGPAFGGLVENKSTQHILFSIFCALLIPISYHLSRSSSDFSHIWTLIKTCLISTYQDDYDEHVNTRRSTSSSSTTKSKNSTKSKDVELQERGASKSRVSSQDAKEEATENEGGDNADTDKNSVEFNQESSATAELEPPDPLKKKLQGTVNTRLKNDFVVSSLLALIFFGLHCSTVFRVLQPDINIVLHSVAIVLGFLLHYVLPQMRKHMPWLCFARPIIRQHEFGQYEALEAAKLMWFEKISVYLGFFERNILYPLIFISALTADSQSIVNKFGIGWGTTIVVVCALKCVRSAYSDAGSQFLILAFAVLLFKFDFAFASETFLIDYFFVSLAYRKFCDFLLKLQFIVTYIAPWQITWGSAFHAFAQPFSVPHSAMLFLQAAVSAVLSTPLNPFLGSAIFLTSYVRPIKFWERDYNTRRIDHSNTRLSSQLERDLGADDNNLNSIFYEHLTRSLQHSLCGDLMLGRWGNVNQGDCFVLASDYLNCLVHIIELGNGLCTFQIRGLEFRGTYCQQREVEAISEGIQENDGCCCCSPGHLPRMLSMNAMFSTRWLAWQVVAAQYVLEGYSISENLATATLQVFEFRKVLITYYIKSIIYFVTRNPKLEKWLISTPIQEALASTLNRQFVDLDPTFNYNLDEDFDCRALGITRSSFCSVYLGWIQFCYGKRTDSTNQDSDQRASKPTDVVSADAAAPSKSDTLESLAKDKSETSDINTENNPKSEKVGRFLKTPIVEKTIPKDRTANNTSNPSSTDRTSSITKDSPLVSLCLSLGLLARRSLASATHSSLSGVEFFLHGLHALFKGDFRITSPRDEWVFADMELLHGVVAPAVKMALKLHQDHFSSPDEYLDPDVLYEAITTNLHDLVISHEADPVWRSAVLRGAPNLLALRHVLEDGSDEYRIIRLTKRFLSFRVIKLNRECVRGLWSGQQQELIYLRNRNPERGSIQNAKQALRNIINSSCDQPIGYPIYVSPLTTSYADTNAQLCQVIGGSITLESIKDMILKLWSRMRERCREGCSSGSGIDAIPELPSVYFSPTPANNPMGAGTITYGSQSLSGAGNRGSLASMNKPTSSTLLAGLLNREREQEREIIRESRNSRKIVTPVSFRSRSDRERRATLPITSSVVTGGSRDLILKDSMGSTSSGLRQFDFPEDSGQTPKISSSATLGPSKITKCSTADSLQKAESRNFIEILQNATKSDESPSDFIPSVIELNKKVIIVDEMEIYDNIDTAWPERMSVDGTRSTWKDWVPREGMVGNVVHIIDQRSRTNTNQILYLIEIGDRYVPVRERGIREYNQIVDSANRGSQSQMAIVPVAHNVTPSEQCTPASQFQAIFTDIPLDDSSSDNSLDLDKIDKINEARKAAKSD